MVYVKDIHQRQKFVGARVDGSTILLVDIFFHQKALAELKYIFNSWTLKSRTKRPPIDFIFI